MSENANFLHPKAFLDIVCDPLLIRKKQLVTILLLEESKFRCTRAVAAHIRAYHSKSGLLQLLRKSVITLLVLLHAVVTCKKGRTILLL